VTLFYSSQSITFTYDQLIKNINSKENYYEEYFAKDYIDFVTNTLIALIHNFNITLVDYRNRKSANHTEKKISVHHQIDTLDDLLERLKASSSNFGIFSSGTEGQPKLIFQSVLRLLKSVRIHEKYTHSKWAFTYNPAHSAGIQMLLQVIFNKATLYDMYKLPRQILINTIQQNQLTHLSATPTFYRMLAPYNFVCPTVENVTLNGEKSTQALIDNVKFAFPNARIRNIYGSTESGPLLSSDNATFTLSEKQQQNIKVENGELMIHHSIMSKSIGDVEWYRTGDLVKVISEQPLTIEFICRKTRILNVGGQNVNPQEIEEIILQYPGVKDVRVYGRENKMIGQVVCAEVQLLESSKTGEKELIQFCKDKMAQYKIPRIIKLVEITAVGNTGKKMI
jgi:acyl-coenzyme A synthetase/AMP-(fatty) acid ligase